MRESTSPLPMGFLMRPASKHRRAFLWVGLSVVLASLCFQAFTPTLINAQVSPPPPTAAPKATPAFLAASPPAPQTSRAPARPASPPASPTTALSQWPLWRQQALNGSARATCQMSRTLAKCREVVAEEKQYQHDITTLGARRADWETTNIINWLARWEEEGPTNLAYCAGLPVEADAQSVQDFWFAAQAGNAAAAAEILLQDDNVYESLFSSHARPDAVEDALVRLSVAGGYTVGLNHYLHRLTKAHHHADNSEAWYRAVTYARVLELLNEQWDRTAESYSADPENYVYHVGVEDHHHLPSADLDRAKQQGEVLYRSTFASMKFSSSPKHIRWKLLNEEPASKCPSESAWR
jgi:hypothetical protein